MADGDTTTTTTTTVRIGRFGPLVLLGAGAAVALVGSGVWLAANREDTAASPTSTTDAAPSSTVTVPVTVDTAALQVGSAISGSTGVSVVGPDGELYTVLTAPAAVAFANGDGVVVAQARDSFGADVHPPTPIGPILVRSGRDLTEIPARDGELLRLLDIGDVRGLPVALAAARTGTTPDDTDERLLLISLATGERADLGSVGGWESGVQEAVLLGERIATLVSAGAEQFVQVRSLDGTAQFERTRPVIDRTIHLAAATDTILLLEPQPLDSALLVTRINATTGAESGPARLTLRRAEGSEPLEGFCSSPDWNGAVLLCDQPYGPPITIDLESGLTTPIGGVADGIARHPRVGSDGSAAAASAPTPPQTCERHGGNSPATFDPAEGTYAAYVIDLDLDARAASATFDIVQVLTGQDAIDAYQADHPDDPEGPPNDHYLINDNNALRGASLAPTAAVWLVRLAQTGSASLKAAYIGELDTYLADDSANTVYWLTFTDGTVTELCEQYQP